MSKTIYKCVYPFEVADLVRAGKDVFVLDKKIRIIANVSEMKAIKFIEATSGDDKINRYVFWIEESEVTSDE